jgi:hypothetical protein
MSEPDVPAIFDSARLYGAHQVALCALVDLLIKKGALEQGDVIAHFEKLSKEFMAIKDGMAVVVLADAIADCAAGRSARQPS